MILAAAVCPHPPLLVPEVAQGAASDLDELRRSCREVVAGLLAFRPDRIVVVGAGLDHDLTESAGGSLAPFGLDVRGGPGQGLPLAHTMGAWLLDQAGWNGPRTYTSTAPSAAGRVALLVMADGSAKRSTTAPGYFDERAADFDGAIAAALRDGDAATLAALDPAVGAELWAGGVPALRVLGETAKDATISARLHCDVAPFGVGYWVADWTFN